MLVKFQKNDQSALPFCRIKDHIDYLNRINGRLYSTLDKDIADLFKFEVGVSYSKKVFVNYRKNFIALKVSSDKIMPTSIDNCNSVQVVKTKNAVIYRIMR